MNPPLDLGITAAPLQSRYYLGTSYIRIFAKDFILPNQQQRPISRLRTSPSRCCPRESRPSSVWTLDEAPEDEGNDKGKKKLNRRQSTTTLPPLNRRVALVVGDCRVSPSICAPVTTAGSGRPESTPFPRTPPPPPRSLALDAMGLFSRKPKAAKANSSSITISQSSASLDSSNSRLAGNRASAGTISPRTPLSPMSPVKLPKVDLPRPPDPQLDPAGYLRSLGAVRDRSRVVMDRLLANKLNHFDVDLTKLADVVTFVSGLIKVPHAATN